MKQRTLTTALVLVAGCAPGAVDDDDDVDCAVRSEANCASDDHCSGAYGRPACGENPDGALVYFGCFSSTIECDGEGETCVTTAVGDIYLSATCSFDLPSCTAPCGNG